MGNKQAKLSEQLILAIQDPTTSSNDLERLIHQGVDLNRRHNGTLPLHCVCRYKDIHCLKILLQYGVKVNKVDGDGNTTLHCVAKRNSSGSCVAYVDVLIQHGADIDVRHHLNRTPLYCAVETNHIECVKRLLKHGASVNKADLVNKAPLHLAAETHTVDYVKLLLEHGADINVFDHYKKTPLLYAIYHNTVECVELLLHHGGNINARDICNETPLQSEVKAKNLRFVKLLLQHGADANVRDRNNSTPLHTAVDHYKLLRQYGRELNARATFYIDSRKSAQLAAYRNIRGTVELLLQYGANANTRDKDNKPLLHWAVNINNVLFVKLLLQHGAHVDTQVNNHNTALSIAVDQDYLNIVKILLDYNADVNIRNLFEETPLMIAALRFGRRFKRIRGKACLELLIQASGQFDILGEDTDIQDIMARDKELSEMLLPYCCHPLSLQALCRYQIRSSLRNQFLPDVIPSLNLPPSLQRFVLLQE